MLPILLLLSPGSAEAVRPPTDYRAVVVQSAAAELEHLNAQGRMEQAMELGERFGDRVEPAGPVVYEMAYAANRLGDTKRAMRLYDRALALSPDMAVAFYDRGELHLLAGDEAAARADFERAAELRPDHWAIHFRLAHLAGRAGQAAAFEDHLVEALRHGFDFRTLQDDPEWRSWSRDPTLGPVLKRLIVVYSDESLFDALQEPR